MKKLVANSIVAKGDLYGGEIEPGTFHRECPVFPDITLISTGNPPDEDGISVPPEDDKHACGCIFIG